jgi:hypothetical protein
MISHKRTQEELAAKRHKRHKKKENTFVPFVPFCG